VKTIYSYVQRGIIPHMRMESNVRFSKHQVLQWFRETQLLPAPTGEVPKSPELPRGFLYFC
jgi:hypothetical protein